MTNLTHIAQTDLGTVSLARYWAGGVMPEHAHDHASVSVVLAGGLAERVGRREVEAGPFSVVVKPAEVAHEDRFGRAGARMLGVDLTAEAVRDLPGWREGGAGWRWHHAPEGTERAVRMGLDALAETPDETAVADAIAALLHTATVASGALPPWLARVREHLHDAWREAPTVSALADEAGVHRVHLARRFRQHLGTTVTAYLRGLRVQSAAHALAAGDAPLAQIALDAGFADQPHFSRSFRRATGLAPGAYRQRVRT